jgi:hypothetical protein
MQPAVPPPQTTIFAASKCRPLQQAWRSFEDAVSLLFVTTISETDGAPAPETTASVSSESGRSAGV